MESIKLKISGIQALVVQAPVLTSGMVGLKAEFEFDSAWDGLTKTAVYKAGGVTKDDIGIGDISEVPSEVLARPCYTLYVGVYGASPDGTVILPTVWAAAGKIRPGANPSGDESVNPSLPVWQKLLDNDLRQDTEIAASKEKIGDIETAMLEIKGKYYSSLSAAITDINAGTEENKLPNDTSATVKVFQADNGRTTVMLIDNVYESVQIDISKDIDLVLNGYTLSLTTAEAYLNFTAGTNCTINGEAAGSTIKKENITASEYRYILSSDSDSLKVSGGEYIMNCSLSTGGIILKATPTCKLFEVYGCNLSHNNDLAYTNAIAKCIQSQATNTNIQNTTMFVQGSRVNTIHTISDTVIDKCTAVSNANHISWNIQIVGKCTITDSNISAVAEDNDMSDSTFVSAYGILLHGDLTIKNSTVFTDAPGGDANDNISIGIINYADGTLTCIDTDVTGTHSGVQNSGNLYVTGGTFNGYSHGGFYFVHKPTNNAYINNAIIQYNNYTGKFTDVFSGGTVPTYAAFYLGDSSNTASDGISVYMDGCTTEGRGGEAFVVRSASSGNTNILYISNTTVNSPGTIRLSRENTGGTAEMKIGMGCNFDSSKIGSDSHPEYAENTDKLYRLVKADMDIDGRDYNALLSYSVNATDGKLGDIETALDSILAIQESLIGGSGA